MINFEVPQRGGGSRKRTAPSFTGIVIVPDYNLRDDDRKEVYEQIKAKPIEVEPTREKKIEEKPSFKRRKRINKTTRKGELKRYGNEVMRSHQERKDYNPAPPQKIEMLPVYDFEETENDKEIGEDGFVTVRFRN